LADDNLTGLRRGRDFKYTVIFVIFKVTGLEVSPPPFLKWKIIKMKNKINKIFLKVEKIMSTSDFPCHDYEHVLRVYNTSTKLAEEEKANLFVVEPAALMHDLGRADEFRNPEIDHAERSVELASEILKNIDYPLALHGPIYQAISEHRFSKNIKPSNLESAILQDADRLDALGAIGIMRCISYGVFSGIRIYDPRDIFAKNREVDDKKFMIDHFYQKLFKLPSFMSTESGKKAAENRVLFMKDFIEQLNYEVWGKK